MIFRASLCYTRISRFPYVQSRLDTKLISSFLIFTVFICVKLTSNQARNKGGGAQGANPHPGQICWTLFESIAHSLKILGHSQKTFPPPGVQSWLRVFF